MLKIKMELNEKQANVIKKALDLYSRLGMGQVKEIDSIFSFDFNKKFDKNASESLLSKLQAIYFPELYDGQYLGIFNASTPENCKIGYDIIQVLRNKIAWHKNPDGGYIVDFGPPIKSSKEDFCNVEVTKK